MKTTGLKETLRIWLFFRGWLLGDFPQLCVPINFVFSSILMHHRTAGFLPLLRWPHLIYRKTVQKEQVYNLRMMPSVSRLQNYLYLHWLLPHGLPPQRRWYISSYPSKDIPLVWTPGPSCPDLYLPTDLYPTVSDGPLSLFLNLSGLKNNLNPIAYSSVYQPSSGLCFIVKLLLFSLSPNFLTSLLLNYSHVAFTSTVTMKIILSKSPVTSQLLNSTSSYFFNHFAAFNDVDHISFIKFLLPMVL